MKRRARRLLFIAVSVLLTLTLYLFMKDGPRLDIPTITSKSAYLEKWSKTEFAYSASKPPKITIIVIWFSRGSTPPNYLPYFFSSVANNPQVNLLFISVDQTDLGCTSYSSAPNVQEVCLDEDQYYQLHVDFLCKRWQCTAEDRIILSDRIKRAGVDDKNNTFFRILRNGIFMRWIDPATTIWGWCDADTFWGNFTRTFPWDIAHDYDILAVSSQPEFANQRLLFTRGHMAFFRHSPELLDKFHSYPKFSSLSAYLTQPPTLIDAEESEFSHYMFSDEDSFTFLSFEGMSESYDTIFLSDRGTFYVPLQKKDMVKDKRKRLIPLVRPENKVPISPTFTTKGARSEKKTRVFLDGRYFEGSLWFDNKHATYVETGWDNREREQKPYFMRRTPYGPVLQRIEQRERYLNRDNELGADETLYKHWQAEKHRPWFRRIPKGGLEPGQVFVQYNRDEAEIWNEDGEIVYTTGDDSK